MLLVYIPKITNRCDYIFKLIFNELLGLDVNLTNNSDEFLTYEGPKINYSSKVFGDELFFDSAAILFETGIKVQELRFIPFAGTVAFFPVYNKKSALPFDPFAASFYLVSRYEEYFPFIQDRYDRFEANQSIAFKNDFLKKPVVNIWALKIKEILLKKFPALCFPEKNYQFIPTIDVDAAWSYKQKGVVRSLGGYCRSLLNRDFSEIIRRTKVLTNIIPDPFDTFTYQLELQKKHNLKPIYFVLFAEYGLNDKNIPINNPKFHILVKTLSDYAEVGIHPSYGSNTNPKKLQLEVRNLSKVLNKEITRSRQHFLKLTFPTTYRNLINLDISDDYTMGYASETGFRAGICDSFLFYDIDQDAATPLRIHPFAVMDGTLQDYKNISANNAPAHLKQLIDEVKAVNGTFISLWHNQSLSNLDEWTGWRAVYEEMIKLAHD